MVINEKYNFIFIRIPKNASTSCATFFVENYCDKKDIYTQIGDSGIKSNNIAPKLIEKYKHQYRFIHLTLNEIIEENLISIDKAKNFKKIGVIRNPFERQLSLFFFLHRNNKQNATVKQFREEFKRGYHVKDGSNWITQADYLKIKSEYINSEFWLYEKLDQHIDNFIIKQNKKIKTPLGSFKSTIKPKKNNLIEEYYDLNTRRAIETYYSEDFEIYWRLKDEFKD